MRPKIRWFLIMALALILLPSLLSVNGPAPAQAQSESSTLPNRVLARALDIEMGMVEPLRFEQRVDYGKVRTLLEATGELSRRAARQLAALGANAPTPAWAIEHDLPAPTRPRTQGCRQVIHGSRLDNVRVNQDCTFRFQGEEAIAVNPHNPRNLIVGYNDGRIGFNHGGYAWTFDAGKTWGDLVPPFFSFLLLDGHVADAFSDPTVTFDSNSNAYIGGVFFDINSAANALLVSKSNAGIGGAFYHRPSVSPTQLLSTLPGIVANENNPAAALDKELMVADANPASPKANNVYMTYTRFALTGTGVGIHSPILFSQSTNGGVTWSAGIEISGAAAALCTFGSAEANPNACDQDQGSQPIVGPDGTVHVAFFNGNTPLLGVNQHLIVSCPPGANCALPPSWSAPHKIADDDIGKQPSGPDPNTGCPAGRQCLPPNGYRMDDSTEGSISVDNAGNLYAVWADFRNGKANCKPNGPAAMAVPPCDNDVFYSFSINGGLTWSPTRNLTPASRLGPSAQWQPWSQVTTDGDALWVAFYDRHYGFCEVTGCNDITLARIRNPRSGAPRVTYRRLTPSSMPNMVPANNPFQAGFLGDYMWVTVDDDGNPHVVWASTAGREGTVETDVYYARIEH